MWSLIQPPPPPFWKIHSIQRSQEVPITTLIGYTLNQFNMLSISSGRNREGVFVFDSEYSINTSHELKSLVSCFQIACSTMSHVDRLLKDHFVRINVPNVPKPSIVWTYFGHLYSHSGELSDCDHFYCCLCFDRAKAEEPDSSLSSMRKRIAV